MKSFALVLSFFLSFSVFGQYKRKPSDPFPKPPRFAQNGWFLAPGGSYTLHNYKTTNLAENNFGVLSNITPKSKIGYYLEGGRYKLTNRLYFIRYIDYGLSIKNIRGAEDFLNADPLGTLVSNGTNNYADHSASIFFNANNVIPISDKWFVQNTLGVLGEYVFIANRNNLNLFRDYTYPDRLRGEFTYKFGMGYKYSNYLLIIQSIQTSLLQLYPWQNLTLTLPFFQSWYKPVFFSLRFVFLRNPKAKKCPPVDAIGIPEGYEQQE